MHGVVSRLSAQQLGSRTRSVRRDFRSAIDAVFVEWQSALVERIAGTRGGARLDRAKRTDAAAFIISVYSGAMTLAKSKQMLCRFEALREFCRIGYASGSSRLSWADSHKGRRNGVSEPKNYGDPL